MIKKFIKRLFARRSAAKPKHRASGRAELIPPSQHPVRRAQISSGARRVTEGLQAAGFEAFVVGGAVRDLLLGRTPKDFDVATNATPEEVRKVFRRARIIGRRFRLVHVMFGEETVEVSTYRRAVGHEDAETDAHGRILRDNEFGDQAQDAARRDFTANALFFDPATEIIHDYHHGVADVEARILRMIGDPATRYREDPVRMLRAVRLSAKLGMQLAPATAAPIAELKELLANVPKARLFDEMLKLLLSGHALDCIMKLREMHLHHGLLPLLDVILEQPLGEKFILCALRNTDERIAQDKPVSPGFLFAALLWHEVVVTARAEEAAGQRPFPALHAAMESVLRRQSEHLAITHRYDAVMKEIWAMQPRFEQRTGQRPFRLLESPRFRAGFDFLLLRIESGKVDPELGQWWQAFQDANPEQRTKLLQPPTAGEGGMRRRRRRRKPKTVASPSAT